MKKVILIDGNNLMFRSYFATAYTGSVMRNSKGQATNALFGFVSMLKKIIEEENPQYMVVAFDIGKNFRHDKYADYKAGRNATPDDLKSQMPIARDILDAMGIKHLECEGYEADDIIGTLAKEADLDPEYDGLIISSDHDLMQLISPVVGMKMLKGQGGSIYYTVDSFREEYGFDPIKIIDLKALMGDASDNIPGVKGIGEKTARNLIQTYGSLDGVYENIESIKGKMKEKLETDKDNAYFSYELATIYRDVPLSVDLESLMYDGIDQEKLRNIFQELEFHSFLKSFSFVEKKDEKFDFKIVEKCEDIDNALEFSYFIECDRENYHYAEILGMSLYDGKTAYFVPADLVKEVLEKNSSKLRYTYALKKNMAIARRFGIDLMSTDFDLILAYYLLENTTKDDLALKMSDAGGSCYYYEDAAKGKVDEIAFRSGLAKKAKFIWEQKDEILKRIFEAGMSDLYNKIEMPLVKVLSDMEETGIRVDVSVLKEMQGMLKEKIDKLEAEIYELAGFEFNIASPKQLGDVLFNKLEIPYPGKKSSSYSTDVGTLEKIAHLSPLVPKILEFRTVSKLFNTYVEPLETFIMDDGKIHTIYKQTLTRTGRLSSVEPNLQNIPTREEEGKLVRKAFVSEENSVFLSADYSQIELRILASISGDETMCDAFMHDEDIHRRVAADIHGKRPEDVTKHERSTAKAVIFGIVYGISGFGLGENLNISPKEAKQFIEKYYEMYPKVKEYMDSIKKEAYDNGYVKTLFGRIRHIDELKSPVYMVRSGGERIALNTPIQGTGADIMKIAMVDLYNALKRKGLKSKIILQVHDEVILNVYEDELEVVKVLVEESMTGAASLKVPLKIGIETGKNWYDAK
ncbi:MAG TPA: DNA polymerase I [Firmicutes bacterium]|nr:DNA polymerase I [Bacillota bacterium]